VAIDGRVVYDNRSKCSQIPTEGEILSLVRRHKEPLPGEEIRETVVFPVAPHGR
jgi:hypothetical protein